MIALRVVAERNEQGLRPYRHQLPGQLEEDARRLDEYLTGATAGKLGLMRAKRFGRQHG